MLMTYHFDMSSGMAASVIALGLTGGLICYLFTNISPGGLIVPGVLALTALQSPASLGATILATAVTYGATQLLRKFGILYGKRLFAVAGIMSSVLTLTAFLVLHKHHPALFPGDTTGFILPGLLTYQLCKQPVVPTLVATATVATSVAAVTLLALAL